ncbi:MAG: alpha/beta-type small acid-soluble spore protein [Defluviitaleaceae bacterium]|nr:alpha/beta-type small acid-soluble spore protein [Defluviitaleaceae bacterium]
MKEHEELKMEIAEELGLLEKVTTNGWKSLTAKESGRIGGILARRKMKADRENE